MANCSVIGGASEDVWRNERFGQSSNTIGTEQLQQKCIPSQPQTQTFGTVQENGTALSHQEQGPPTSLNGQSRPVPVHFPGACLVAAGQRGCNESAAVLLATSPGADTHNSHTSPAPGTVAPRPASSEPAENASNTRGSPHKTQGPCPETRRWISDHLLVDGPLGPSDPRPVGWGATSPALKPCNGEAPGSPSDWRAIGGHPRIAARTNGGARLVLRVGGVSANRSCRRALGLQRSNRGCPGGGVPVHHLV
ncbi:uncharacterized protein N7482_000715 [Penicillium canariense]|uniref:Uncharacterized protein n=1 Tax=Penicillium canariense TaxID=189055 RepID=A0A9W9IDT9_9EURO|nr:uncharacterized protein N7482_000715 [Penicillium canariense]KAJ5174838.1 hypothetical protein N7482_000715 [Penicillium canariense]